MNVLYVEDNLLDADLTRRELYKTAPEIKLDIVSSVRTAMARLDQSSYDVVLTDMRLLDGEGLSLLAHIRERALPLVVILIADSGDEETAVAALKAGADDYLIKRADYLARLPETLEIALQRYRAETAGEIRPLRVLYAEDNAIDVDLTRRHLARHAPHIHLDVVSTPDEALQRLQDAGAGNRHDVLLVDYRLPGANALELLKELRRVPGLDTPVVLVTSQGGEEIAVQALKLGATDCVVKTTDYLYRLPSAIENAFHRAQLAREQTALRDSETRYRIASELTSDFMYSIRIEPDGTIVPEWNAGALTHITGYEWKEFEGPNVPQFVHPDDVPLFDRHLAALLAGKSDVAEFRVITKDGQVRWARNYGRPVWDPSRARTVRVYGAAQDITESKRTEEEIRQLNQRLERRAKELAALNGAARAITSSLDPQRVLEMVIGEVRSMLDAQGASVLLRDPLSDDLVFHAAAGPGSKQVVGVRVPITAGIAGWVMRERQSIVVADAQHDPRFYPRIDTTTGLTTRTVVAVPLKFQAAVWGVIEAINKASGSFDEHDLELLEALAGSAAIAIENARLYTSVQDTNNQLRAAIQSKDEMIQNVSHELRTPLSLIYGYVELLENNGLGPLTTEQDRAIQIMHRQGDRLRFMVDRLLMMQTFSADKLKWVRIELGAWLQQAVLPWEMRATHAGIRLRLEANESLPVTVDPDFLGQVIENLLDNALKFSPVDSEILVRAWAESGEAVVAISDRGVGIPPDKLRHVFERFYQVNGSATRRFGGMGIGLALCRTIMEAHGGKIWAESEGQGQGSTFCFTLPITQSA